MYSWHDTACAVGFPIRKFPDQSLLAAPRDLSQRATSFIASQCQGIHQMPLLRLIAKPSCTASKTPPEDSAHPPHTTLSRKDTARWCTGPSRPAHRFWCLRELHMPNNVKEPTRKPPSGAVQAILDRGSGGSLPLAGPSGAGRAHPRAWLVCLWQKPSGAGRAHPRAWLAALKLRGASMALGFQLRLVGSAAKPRWARKPSNRSRLAEPAKLVEPDGIEPTTSCLQSTRSPN